jgi:hypothetical protein
MRDQHETLAVLASDADIICTSHTPAAGGVQAIPFAGSAASITLDVARNVTITTAADEEARTFTVTGYDRRGNAISEAVAGVDTGVAQTVKNFLTVTSVTVDGDTTGAVTVGSGDVDGVPLIVNPNAGRVGFQFNLDTAGAASMAMEKTLGDVINQGEHGVDWTASASGKTTIFAGVVSMPCTAVRFSASSITSGATFDYHVLQEVE